MDQAESAIRPSERGGLRPLEFADTYGVSIRAVRAAIQRGEINVVHLGRMQIIPRHEQVRLGLIKAV